MSDSSPGGFAATIPLAPAGMSVTELCFGTSKLLRLHSSRARQRLLDAAYDCGIRHFDTARSYGLGEAEHELGLFLRRHPDATVATKLGIRITASGRWLRPLQGLARRCVDIAPGIRRVLRRTGTPLVAPRDFDVVSARTSLEASRNALGVDRIGIVFLHEPDGACVIPPGLVELFALAREKGWIGGWGLSGNLADLLDVRRAHPDLAPVLQYASDAVTRSRLPQVPAVPHLTFGPFSHSLDAIASWLQQRSPLDAWRRDVDAATDRSTIAGLLLADAVTPPHRAPVVFSTTSVAHLTAATAAVGDPATRARVERLRDWIGCQTAGGHAGEVGPT